jgi:hypothetical protein
VHITAYQGNSAEPALISNHSQRCNYDAKPPWTLKLR